MPDVIVVGGGPAGYLAAILAQQRGLDTVCVEKDRLGGVCLNVGCIPSKALLRAAEQLRWIQEESEKFGIRVGQVEVDYPKVIARSRRVADQSERGVQFLFKKYGVTLRKGTARVVGPGRVQVGDEVLEARHVLLATGARPKLFPGMVPDGERILTYKDAIVATTRPDKVIVLGSGAIGLEFAYFWNSFGADVTVVEALDRICPLEDPESSAEALKALKKQGIGFELGQRCTGVRREGDAVHVSLADGRTLTGTHCLLALGVTPNTEDLGLESVGIELDRGFVKHDTSYRTTAAGFYAIGDLCGPPALAHAAYAEAHVCVERIAGHVVPDVDYGNMPAATFCQPQIASVGLTEPQARASGVEVRVGRFPLSANGKARAIGSSEGLVKVLVDPQGVVLGAHLVGHDASELLANFVMARGAEVTAGHFLHTVHAHPTLGEAMYEAVAVALGKSAHI